MRTHTDLKGGRAKTLPSVTVLRIMEIDDSGDPVACPEKTSIKPEPKVLVLLGQSDPSLKIGDRVLASLARSPNQEHDYSAKVIRRIGRPRKRILGVFYKTGIIESAEFDKKEWIVKPGDEGGAKSGDLVEAESIRPDGGFRSRVYQAKVVKVFGDYENPGIASTIAIRSHQIPEKFNEAVLDELGHIPDIAHENREDLTDLPLVTIDPADARDRDDAVYAISDESPGNPGGHVIWVAIADVAHYVRPQTSLDIEARERGNSTYFPDRVVPMLPEKLSNDLCSLHEKVERPCIAVEMTVNASGEKTGHRFVRGIMKSRAALSYEQAQSAYEGNLDKNTKPYLDSVIAPLFEAYHCVRKASGKRQPLDLDLEEHHIELSRDGRVEKVFLKERLDAHRLIEEFMILANVCAAETLEKRKTPLLYRVHETPAPGKVSTLQKIAKSAGFNLSDSRSPDTGMFNTLLRAAAKSDSSDIISLSVLKSMKQAYYSPKRSGHFGLNLKRYSHFTSPIRRYSDLVAHRALITAHQWGDDGLSDRDIETLSSTADHISETERRSMVAERDTKDRYLAAYLKGKTDGEFTGRIAGVINSGVFVKLDESGGNGFIPARSVSWERFRFDRQRETLTGEKSGTRFALGMPVTVRIAEAEPITGRIRLELVKLLGDDSVANVVRNGKRKKQKYRNTRRGR